MRVPDLPLRLFALLSLFASPCTGFAQALVGALLIPPETSGDQTQVITQINVSNPANADGQIRTATFVWSAAPCPAAAKIKVFRPSIDFFFTHVDVIAERGPFDVDFVTQTVPLSPPISVQRGDLIGITNLTACGTATFRATGFPGSTAQVAGDMQGSGAFVNRSEYLLPYSLELHASAGSESPSVVNFLPVAISAPGRAGAFFRTRVQLRNPRGTPISGHLVFHPAFAQATPSDPALGYSLGPWEVRTIDDLVATMGQTGIGSVDVVPNNSEDQGPTVQASVYSSSSAGGVLAFGEPTIRPAEVALGGGALIGPTDPTSTRWNIGVRTLEAGATVTIVIFDSNGIGRSLITRTYPPNYFEQVPASVFLGGQEPGPDMTLVFSVTSGSAIVYGVTADNLTQSSVLRLAGREF